MLTLEDNFLGGKLTGAAGPAMWLMLQEPQRSCALILRWVPAL